MTTAQTITQEDDVRLKMLNTFMTCPHRDTDKVLEIHKELQAKDPVFYAHLACWYLKNGEIRDLNEIFSAMLACDPYLENRETGIALWQQHLPFMKAKILGFIHGKTVKISTKTGKKIKSGGKEVEQRATTEKEVGLKRGVPTSLRNEVEKYLRWLESDMDRFDSVALRSFDELKSLYMVTGKKHGIKPSPRAQQILFKKQFPPDSKLAVFKKIATSKSPEEQATQIVENKIPYTIAVGLIDKITPPILVALVNSMSPQELVNNVASLQDKGAYDNPDLKKMIEAKLGKATTSKSVSTLKSKTAKATGRVQDESINQKLDEIADKQVKRTGAIKMSTGIMVDKCVVGATIVATEMGLIPIIKMVPEVFSKIKEIVVNLRVATREGFGIATRIFVNGIKPVKFICTSKGYELGASHNHPVLCYDPSTAILDWKDTSDVRIGEYVALKRGSNCFGIEYSFSSYVAKDPYQPNEKLPKLPKTMSPALASWIGYLASEGRHLVRNSRIEFSNYDDYLLQDFVRLTKELFNLKAELKSLPRKNAVVISAGLFDFLINAIGLTRSRARECEVPLCVLMSSKESHISFLRSYFSGDGGIMNRRSGILAATSASKELLITIQVMLLNLGIVSSLHSYKSRATNGKNIFRNYWRLTIGGNDALRFIETIGFSSPYKQKENEESIKNNRSLTWSARWDSIPGLFNIIRTKVKNGIIRCKKEFPSLAFHEGHTVEGRIATELLKDITKVLPELLKVGSLKEVLDSSLFLDKVVKISDGEEYVFDFHVERSHSFISNGIVSHNSGSMRSAIEVGKRVASLVSGAMEAEMHVVAFDSAAREIHANGTTLTAWETAFKPVNADGQTSMGVALDYLIRANWPVEQIVIITDEGENQNPRFADVFPKYVEKFGTTPRVIVIHLKSDDGSENFVLTQTLKLRNIEFEVFQPKDADYYGLPGLITFLSRHSKLDLIYEIMDTPLMQRRVYKAGEPVPAYKEPVRKIALA